ncbi:hypothetical protein ACFLZB_03745 [Nanoarchaeota archaeon]
MQTIQEGLAKVKVHTGKISRELPVFYNPLMKTNRDSSILILKSLNKKNLQIALPLAASGVRGIRLLKELPKSTIKNIVFNDLNPKAIKSIKENIKLNKIKSNKIIIKNQDANLFLLQSKGFDYIDLDPFGSPNPFLNNAIQRLSRTGILAITATDTSALTGTFPRVSQRKYWAQTFKNELMHELGLRILIRKVQLIGMQFDKALTPIFSFYKDHYYRIFFQNKKSKEACDNIVKQHLYFLYNPKTLERKTSKYNKEDNFIYIGPLWTGQLFEKKLMSKIKTEDKFFQTLKKELNLIGFYDLHKIAKVHKTKVPQTEDIIKKIKKLKFKAAPTHFSSTGFKSTIPLKKLISTLK